MIAKIMGLALTLVPIGFVVAVFVYYMFRKKRKDDINFSFIERKLNKEEKQ